MPEEDFKSITRGALPIWVISIASLLVLSFFLSFYISKRYISPVADALDKIKTNNYSTIPKINISEIDDLIEYLAKQDEEREALNQELQKTKELVQKSAAPEDPPNLSGYQQFVQNIKTLSAAEQAVFNLYIEGYTAKEITQRLCLSINTIKTHNRHIYQKLNVTSRKELMVYVQMMINREEKE